MTTQNHYTFGDSDRAARRLLLLANAYETPSRELLERFRPPEKIDLALDLGSGPGHTTRLVHRIVRPRRTIGLEASDRYLKQARDAAEPDVEFLQCDVTAPVGVPAAQLVFSRFLLTHVHDPSAALCSFRALVAPGGSLLLQETADLESSHPALARYYALVGQLQAHYGQRLYIGRELERIAAAAPFEIAHSSVRHFEQPAPTMAELHLQNLQTWRADRFARTAFDASELNALEASLQRIVSGEDPAPPVAIGLGELVLR